MRIIGRNFENSIIGTVLLQEKLLKPKSYPSQLDTHDQ